MKNWFPNGQVIVDPAPDLVVRLYGSHPANIVPNGMTQFEIDETGQPIFVHFSLSTRMGAAFYAAQSHELAKVYAWANSPEGRAFLREHY
jgi:hypothetical protein